MFRRVVLGVALAMGALLVCLGLLLAEAHVEIRGVGPELPTTAQIEQLLAGPSGRATLRYVNTATQMRMSLGETGGHPSFVIEGDDGRMLLIDVGMDREQATAFGKPIELLMDADPIEPHGSVAEQMREGAQAVQAVAFTHLHTDHTGGLVALCERLGREVVLFQTPWQAERGNFSTWPGRGDIETAGCARVERLGDGPLVPLPGFPGVYAVAGGGHTPGSTIYVVRTSDGIVVLAGDVTNSFKNLLGNVPKPTVYSLFIVPENSARLETLRLWLAELHAREGITVFVNHDLAVLQRSALAPWSPASSASSRKSPE